MIRVNVRSQLKGTEFRAFVQSKLVDSMQQGAGRVRDRAKANILSAGRVDVGTMLNQVVAETVQVDGLKVTARVEARAPHSLYQHEGTANDGTGYIYPRAARVLRFTPKGGGPFVYAPKVRGVKGVPFLKDALDSATLSDFT